MTDPATIERLAEAAGIPAISGDWFSDGEGSEIERAALARFAELVRADERERCAKVCDQIAAFSTQGVLYQQTPAGWLLRDQHAIQRAAVPGGRACAAAIRATKNAP